MAIQAHTRNKLDISLLDQVGAQLALKIATPGALAIDEDRKFRGSVSDELVSDLLAPAITTGTAITAASAGSAAYAKSVMALAMMLGSYDAARDFLANP